MARSGGQAGLPPIVLVSGHPGWEKAGAGHYFFAARVPAGAIINFRIDAAGTGTATVNCPETRSATLSGW
jgi:hypothetical protein